MLEIYPLLPNLGGCGQTTPRTVSIGIAAFDRDSDLSVSYKRADEALYLAKRHGKNRYVLADGMLAAA